MARSFPDALLARVRAVPLATALSELGYHIGVDRDFTPAKDAASARSGSTRVRARGEGAPLTSSCTLRICRSWPPSSGWPRACGWPFEWGTQVFCDGMSPALPGTGICELVWSALYENSA
jgi:hypothetical protein